MTTFSSLQDLGKQSLQIFAGMRKDKRAERGGNQTQGRNNPIPCLTMSFLLVLVPTDRQRGKTFKDRPFAQWFSHSPGRVVSICANPTIRSS